MPSTRSFISNEINPADVVANRSPINQYKLRRNKKQQNNKGNKTLKLSGNVDLGNDVLKQGKQMRRRNGTRKATKTTTASTTQHPNTISEIFIPNHQHRHNHYESRQQPKPSRKTSTQNPITYRPETSTSRAITTPSTSTTDQPSVDSTTLSEIAMKQLEKVIKC